MKKDTPRKQFSRLFGRQRLSDREYAQLQSLMQQAGNRRYGWRTRFALAVAASVVLALGLQIYLLSKDNVPDSDIAYRISQEVLTNHIHIKQLDMETDSLDTLASGFGQLNFRIVPSRYLEGATLYLVGGRYCTLQGRIATQLVFEADAGHTVSHYQAAYDPAHFGVLPDIDSAQEPWLVSDRGYQVEIWQEQGLVMARAQPLQAY